MPRNATPRTHDDRKDDRNSHEYSAEESCEIVGADARKRGGGHRSGSLGSGTLEEDRADAPVHDHARNSAAA